MDLFNKKKLKKALKIISELEDELRSIRNLAYRVVEKNEALEKMNGSAGLTKKEIKSLISLCHPDKHQGSSLSTKMTSKLLDMRI